MTEEKPSYYAIIPANVRYDTKLPPGAKLLYGEITALSNKEGYCWASNKYFAELYSVTKITISNWVSLLKKQEYISTEIEYHHKSKQIKNRRIYIDGPLLKKSLIGIKENFKDNNKYNTISKEIEGISEKSQNLDFSPQVEEISKKIKRIIPIIEKWNKSEFTSTHKIKNSKTCKNIAKYLSMIQSGKADNYFNFDPDFMNKNNISSIHLQQQLSEEQIIQTIESYLLMFEEGYWPPKKDNLPKSLETFLYNSRQETSFFWKVFCSPPKKLSDEIKAVPIDEDIYQRYRNLFNGQIKNNKEVNRLILSVNDLIKEADRIIDEIGPYYKHTSFNVYIGSQKNKNPFFREHIKWLQMRKKLFPTYISPNSQSFKYFADWIKEFHGYNILPTEEELIKIKKNAEFHK